MRSTFQSALIAASRVTVGTWMKETSQPPLSRRVQACHGGKPIVGNMKTRDSGDIRHSLAAQRDAIRQSVHFNEPASVGTCGRDRFECDDFHRGIRACSQECIDSCVCTDIHEDGYMANEPLKKHGRGFTLSPSFKPAEVQAPPDPIDRNSLVDQRLASEEGLSRTWALTGSLYIKRRGETPPGQVREHTP